LKVVIVGAAEVGFHIASRLAIENQDVVVIDKDSDEINLVACQVADILSPSIKKLARLRNTDFEEYLDIFSKISPRIHTIINPSDRIIIFAKKQSIPKLDKILPVKTDYF
jgi:trk system potassium uptake protein TrkA